MNTAKPALLSIFTFAILIISSWMLYPKEKQHFNCAAPIKAQESESE